MNPNEATSLVEQYAAFCTVYSVLNGTDSIPVGIRREAAGDAPSLSSDLTVSHRLIRLPRTMDIQAVEQDFRAHVEQEWDTASIRRLTPATAVHMLWYWALTMENMVRPRIEDRDNFFWLVNAFSWPYVVSAFNVPTSRKVLHTRVYNEVIQYTNPTFLASRRIRGVLVGNPTGVVEVSNRDYFLELTAHHALACTPYPDVEGVDTLAAAYVMAGVPASGTAPPGFDGDTLTEDATGGPKLVYQMFHTVVPRPPLGRRKIMEVIDDLRTFCAQPGHEGFLQSYMSSNASSQRKQIMAADDPLDAITEAWSAGTLGRHGMAVKTLDDLCARTRMYSQVSEAGAFDSAVVIAAMTQHDITPKHKCFSELSLAGKRIIREWANRGGQPDELVRILRNRPKHVNQQRINASIVDAILNVGGADA